MQRKSRFLILSVGFAATAIGASLYLIPGSNELALTSYKDKEYGKALELYEQAYAENRLTLDTAMHLVGIYLQYAEVEKAIGVMEDFVQRYPDNVEARKELGRLYQYGQRPEDYLRNLEEISRLSGSEETHKELSDAYEVSQETEKNIPLMLTRLMEQGQGNAQEFRDLIRLLAVGERKEEALAANARFRERFPQEMRFNDHELALRLYGDLERKEELVSYAASLHNESLTAQELARVATILLYRANAREALTFISQYRDEIASNDELFAQYIVILSADGQYDTAYALAYARYREGRLVPELYDDLLILASTAGNEALVADLRERIAYERLSDTDLLALLDLAISRDDANLLEKLKVRAQALAQERNDFFLDAILLVAQNASDADARAAEVMQAEPSFQRRMQLGRLCARKKLEGCVSAFHASLPPLDSLSEPELIAVAGVLHDSGKSQEAFALLDETRQTITSDALDRAWFPLAGAFAEQDALRAALQGGTIPESAVKGAYYVAMDNGNTDNAIFLAETLFAQNESDKVRDFVIQAYMKAGQYEQVLPMLREARDTSDAAERDYLFVLSKLAKKNPEYAEELGNYGIQALNSGASVKRRQAIIYALSDAGQQGRIMPYIRDLALSNPKEWAFLYADYLEKSSGKQAAGAFWKEVAQRHAGDTELRTQIAYAMLEQGQRDDAIALFKESAANAAPDAQVVQQLLYLWSPIYPQEGIDWLVTRAEGAASYQERAAWLKLLADGMTDEQLVAFAPSYPAVLSTPEVEERYLYVLPRYHSNDTERTQAITTYLSNRIEASQDPKRLTYYADVAGNNDQEALEYKAYRKAVDIAPKDASVRAAYGVAAYGRADYSLALQQLSQYFAQEVPSLSADAPSYRPHFYYAEALRREGMKEEAKPYYRELVAAASAADPSDAEFHSMAARSLIYSGFEQEGIDVYQKLLAAHPHNRQIRADYSATLVDIKRYGETLESLPAWAQPAPALEEGERPVSLTALGVSGYRLVDGSQRVMLLHPEHETLAFAPEQQGYTWLSTSRGGVGETLMSASDGYGITAMQSPDGQIWLHPVPVENPQQAKLDDAFAIQNELIRARVEVETGDAYNASQRTRALVEQHPHNPQVLGFAANVENFLGNWPYARTLINEAHDIQPDNEDIVTLQRSIERQHAASVYIDAEYRGLDDNDELITSFGASYDISPHLQVGGEVQNNFVDSVPLRLSDGTIDSFSTDRQRAELYLRYFDFDGATAQVSLFANADTPGLGGYYSFSNPLGFTNLGIEVRRPYWEFVESVIDDATRDRLEIGHRYSPDNEIIITGEAGLNNYNTADKSNAASSFTLAGTATRRIYDIPYVAVGYGLDAEYLFDKDTATDANGLTFDRFPLDSREVHSILALGSYDIDEDTNAEGIISFGYDRIGGDAGPSIEGRITHYLSDALSVQGRAAYGFRGGASDGDITRAGVRMQYRY